MKSKATHWTERSAEDYIHRLSSDFVGQIEDAMSEGDINQASIAKTLDVSEGRVSQVLNNPGNITLKKMVEYARAVGRKLTIVAYDDGDHANTVGPIDPTVFSTCWERAGKPKDLFDLEDSEAVGEERGLHRFVVCAPIHGYKMYEVFDSGVESLCGQPWQYGDLSMKTQSQQYGDRIRIESNV